MSERPLPRPEHLRDVPTSRSEWLATRPAGIAALVLGLVAFTLAAVTTEPLWTTPDWRISVPGFAVTAIAALVSIARRERAYALWLVGLGAAGAALVLGYFLLFAIVIGATGLLMLLLHTVM